MKQLIERVDPTWYCHFYKFNYRGIKFHFHYAEIGTAHGGTDDYVDRVCRLKRVKNNETTELAEIDEYELVRQIEKELPSEDLRMDPELELGG